MSSTLVPALRVSIMVAGMLLCTVPAFADGGAGGGGMSGGADQATIAGDNATAAGSGFGGGGGGAGLTGGSGGTVTGGGTGGTGGSSPGQAGNAGSNGSGGGGGAHGAVVTSGALPTASVTGGAGGAGGASINFSGGGGAGGWGAVITLPGSLDWGSTTLSITGGNGGAGGNGGSLSDAGNGGTGGYGLYISQATTLVGGGLTITGGNGGAGYSSGNGGIGLFFESGSPVTATVGSVTGGNGGAAWQSTPGTGGDGIQAGTLTLTTAGPVTGGNAGAGDYVASNAGIGINAYSLTATINGAVTGGVGSTTLGMNAVASNGGAAIVGSILDLTLNANGDVTGGQGGRAENDQSGNGGAGIIATNSLILTVNGATISGGQGGTTGSGTEGNGGVGIIASSATITLSADASVIGGVSGDFVVQANAIELSGNNNVLELVGNGASYATFTGNVVGSTTANDSNSMRLTGTGGTFDLGLIDYSSTAKFQNFHAFEIDTTATTDVWTLTNMAPSAAQGTVWTLTRGTLQVGDSGTSATIPGSLTVKNATVLRNVGDGTSSINIYDGLTIENGGTITLVARADDSTLVVGQATAGALTFGSTSVLNVTLGAPGFNPPLIDVGGALTFQGTLNVTPGAGFGVGDYRLIIFQGDSYGTGMAVDAFPSDYDYNLQYDTANKQVILSVLEGGLYWNGETLTSPPVGVQGGDGVWIAGSKTNWTNAAGTNPASWNGTKAATFAGTAGTVQVDGSVSSGGPVSAKGLKFVTDGYTIAGLTPTDTLTLVNGTTMPKVNVDGSGTTATMSVIIAGAYGLEKIGDGTLVLTGANTYAGGTTVTAGTLQIGTGGSLLGDIANEAALVFSTTGTAAYAGNITGTGTLAKTGVGTLTLTGTVSPGGGTTISGGELQIGAGGTAGSISGAITNNAGLVFSRSNDLTYADVISGSGTVEQMGVSTGKLTLSGTNSYIGATTVTSGVLEVTNVSALGTTQSGTTVSSGASLQINVGGTISEALTLSGAGASGYAGALRKIGSASLSYDGSITLDDDATIDGGANGSMTIAGGIFGTDAILTLSQVGTISGVIDLDGGGVVVGGSWIFSGANTYTGTTSVSNGATLSVQNSDALGSTAGGTTVAAGGTLSLNDVNGAVTIGAEALSLGGGGASVATLESGGVGNSYAGAITLLGDAVISVRPGFLGMTGSLTLSGDITGTGQNLALEAMGTGLISGNIETGTGTVTVNAGTWTLTGENSYSGLTTINGGTLQIGNGGTTGSIESDVANGGALVFNRSNDFAYEGEVSGSGTLEKKGAGTLTLTGANSYTGATTVSAGTLSIGDGTTAGSIDPTGGIAVSTGATLAFDAPNVVSYGGVVSGAGALEKRGAGALVLTGASTLTGLTTVAEGTLILHGGSLAGAVSVSSGGTLVGGATAGTVTGAVTITAGGTLAGTPGTTPLSTGALTFSSATSVLSVTLGAPSTTTAFDVTGNLVLGGVLDITAGMGFGTGTYRLFDYSGTQSGTMAIGDAPAHTLFALDTITTAGQVDLRVAEGLWWNGAGTPGNLVGGSGTWNVQAAPTNWTNQAGSSTVAWTQGGLAIFAGTAGTVTVAGSTSPQVAGIEFITPGYTIVGDTLSRAIRLTPLVVGSAPLISVEEGTATIGVVLSGSDGFEKTGDGTLVLTRANGGLEGVITVSSGALQFQGDASVGGELTIKSGASFVAAPGATGGVALGMTLESGSSMSMAADGVSSLTAGSFTMQASTTLGISLGAPSSTVALSSAGDLDLHGTINFTRGAGFGSGTYRLFDYGGTYDGSGLVLGPLPQYSLVALSTATAGQVNLLLAASQWWNGTTTTPGGSSVQGGDGIWNVSAGATNWTDQSGAMADPWSQGGIAIFAGSAGTVTVSGATNPQVAGMYFLTSGYTITDGGISLTSFNGQVPVITVGNSSPATAGVTATIASALSGTAGLEKAGSGTLTLTGNNSFTGNSLISAGSLVFSGGTSTAGQIDIARDADTTGSMTVTGSGTSLNIGIAELYVGNFGTGSLTVSDGATLTTGYGSLGHDAGSVGSATVTGAGSTWTVNDNYIYVGNYGTGTLLVSDGGTVNADYMYVGYYQDVTGGSVTVTGTGSSLNLVDGIELGVYNNGSLTISDGGSLTSGEAYIGTYTGYYGTYTADATVTGAGSTWNLGTSSITLGYEYSGTVGTLTIEDGGTVTSGTGYLGYYDGTSGVVTVTGAGSTWDLGSAELYVGYSGNGTLTISNGGTVTSGDGYLSDDTTSVGIATVTGSGSTWNLGANVLYLGDYGGTGSLSVVDGGAVIAGQIVKVAGAAGATVTLDGGILRAGADQSDFLSGFASTDIVLSAGGGSIDTNGYAVGVSSILSGAGGLTKAGAGTLTLTGANSYTGGTTVSSGTLQIGSGGTAGSVLGAIANSGTVAFNRSDDISAPGAITGTGALIQRGTGKLTLTGANSAAAGTTVQNGTLEILNGVSLASNVTVRDEATLKGETSGTSGAVITGAVTVQSGGTLLAAPTSATGQYGLSMTSLTLESGAHLHSVLGTNTGTAVFQAGTLTLGGVLDVTDAGGMALGVYRILSYTTLAANNGFTLGATPSDFAYDIQYQPGQVNLAVMDGSMLYWNGSTLSPNPDRTVTGGSGTWSNTAATNWLTSQFNQSVPWTPAYAVFTAAPGEVTVSGAVATTGMQFMVDGYALAGGTVTLSAASGQTQVNVGDGTPTGASYVATIGSVLAGSTGLDKQGLGTLVLTGVNTYTGGTTVTQGTLQIGDGTDSGVLPGNVLNDSVLAFNPAGSDTYAGVISGSGAFTKLGSGTLTLSGINSFSGATSVAGGRLVLENGSSLSNTAATSVAAGATLELGNASETIGGLSGAGAVQLNSYCLTVAGAGSSSYSGTMSGTGCLTKTGAGTQILSGTNDYTGGTTVSEGAISVGAAGAIGTGGLTLEGTGAFIATASFTLTNAVTLDQVAGSGGGTFQAEGAGTTLTVSSAISGAGSLTKTGAGTLLVNGTNSGTGATLVNVGTMIAEGGQAIGDLSAVSVASGARLIIRPSGVTEAVGSIAGAGALELVGATLDAGGDNSTTTYSGIISGSGGLKKSGTGVLTLTGTNTYEGETQVSAGEVVIGGGASLSDTARLSVTAGAKLSLTNANETVGSLGGGGEVALGGHCLITGGDGTSSSFSGAITGSGCLTKTGAGTMALTGTNSYTGTTTISEGAIQVSAQSALGSGPLALQGGGTLAVAASFTFGQTVSLTPAGGAGGGTFLVSDTGGVADTLTLTNVVSGTGALTKTGTGILSMTGANTYAGATTVSGGELRIANGASLSDTARLTVGGGAKVSLTNANETVGSLGGGGEVALGGHCLITGGDGTSSSFSGAITGSGCLTKTGTGTMTLTGTNSYNGTTTVSEGAIRVSAAAALGSGPLALEGPGTLRASSTFTYGAAISLTPVGGVGGGTFEVDAAETLTLTGVIAGLGNLAKTGTGTLVIGGSTTNTYQGATAVNAGTLIAEGGNAIGDTSAVSVATGATLIISPTGTTETVGSLSGGGTVTLDGATLAVGGSNTDSTFAGSIGGSGSLTKIGTGTLTISGTTGTTGSTEVQAGGLAVAAGGSVGGDIYVYDQATLSGGGTVGGTVHVLDGGTLAGVPGAGLTMGGLNMSGAANLAVTLGAPSASPVFTVNGNVTLDGTLNVSSTTGFGLGIYRIVSYTGALTNNGLEVGPLSGGLSGGVQTAIPGQVNLFVEDPNSPILFWNGSHTTPTQAVLGGTGTWTADAQTNWINASGTISKSWNSGFAVFQGAAGTVTVDNGPGQVQAVGMQFVDTGYVVTGGSILLSGVNPAPIRVGDGTAAGAATQATIASVLMGTTGMEKSDFGTLILTGANTYTGGTTVSGGTLQIGNGGATGSILGDVVNNAALAFNLSGETSFGGAISGTGTVTQAGSGTLTLAGANSFSGGTTIERGTLRLTGAQALGTGGLTLNTAGTLRASETFTYGGAIGLVQTGDAPTGKVEVDASKAFTLSGVISGAYGLEKTGTGTLILTGANTYTGLTTVTAGTLQIGNGGTTGSIAGDVLNNASLVFNRSDTYAFTGAISGTGAVTFTGGGTVLFSSPYTGPIAVDDSVVRLQAGTTTASPFTVNAGGILGGSATIGGLTVNNGGTVAPGYSPGTLIVNGAVTFNAGSVYAVDVTPDGQHDLILSTGTVTLSSGASVQVVAVPGQYAANATYTIINTTGTVTGTFGSVTSDYAFLQPTLTYDLQNVYLSLVYTGIDFVEYAQTPNQANVAVAAQALGAGNPVYDAIFTLPDGSVANAFNQLSGEIYPSVGTVIQQESIYLRDAVGARLRQSVTDGSGALANAARAGGPANTRLSQDLTPTLWAQGYGGWGNSFGNGNAASISSSIGGVFAGLDVAIADNARAGIVAGFSQSQFDVDARNSAGSMDNYDIGFYLGAQYGAIGLRGGASYAWHDVNVGRTVSFPGFSGANDAGYTVGTAQVFGEAGYRMAVGAYEFEPFAGLAYVSVSGATFAEGGLGGSALRVDLGSQNTLYTTLGVRAATSIQLGGHTLTPSLTLGWQHAFGDTNSTASMMFAGGATPFQIQGVPIAEDTAILGAGLAYALSDMATFQVNYAGQIASEASQNAFTAQFSLKF
ncbi:autotransporter-associated beta strand repeat-containing protein [Aquabacter cavernae]|uniref:autotransporter-associated beta strand repeat-containing protein n=1 Tax=Aquabacter cavernae TaxID=2496029 RepID=UPI0013DF4485|nr:autotransporter-associated beta strand repeat-containing protein [Aquabacter cavernae]